MATKSESLSTKSSYAPPQTDTALSPLPIIYIIVALIIGVVVGKLLM